MSELARIDTSLGDEIFADLHGEAAVSFADLAELPDGGVEFVAALKAYRDSHPKLDVVFLSHRNAALGIDDLVVRWRWRP